MKKISFLFAALFLFAGLLSAQHRTAEEAAAIAAQFTNAQPELNGAHRAPRKAVNMHLAYKALQTNSDQEAFYVFNQEDNGGYIIVSADERAEEVLGYSESGQFNYETANENFKWWLNRYVKEITKLQTIDASELETTSTPRKATQVTAISPLLINKFGEEIKWYQEAPYSDLLPTDKWDNTKCLTGCVATAASQIMCKWAWPINGTGSKTYVWKNPNKSSQSETLTADYANTTYDWDNMIGQYAQFNSSGNNVVLSGITQAQRTAVATLMLHAGIACDMQYGGDRAGGSGAFTDDMGYGLQTYFKYNLTKFVTTYSRSSYISSVKGSAPADIPCEWSCSVSTITNYFNQDLEAGRPILMGGDSQSSGGHEFVCDGRNSSGKFHINWGWSGEDNGYFSLSSLKPTNYNFSENIDAIIGLYPKVENVNVQWYANGVLFDETTAENGVLALPATNPTCEHGLTFAGWCSEENYESSVAPVFAKAGDQLEADATYYAVFVTNYDLYTTACVEIPTEPVQIRFFVNGEVVSDQTVALGDQPEVPAVPQGCDDFTFVGWWTAALPAENTVAKTWVSDFKARKAQDYFAVFTRTVDNGYALTNDFKKITTTAELENANYIVVGSYNSNFFAMKNEVISNYYINQQAVTPSSNTITTTDGNIIWKITKNGDAISFYNEAISKYLYMYQNGTKYNLGLSSDTEGIEFKPSVNNGVWDFISTTFSGQHLEYYGSKKDFCAYMTSSDPIYLYKQEGGSSIVTYFTSTITCQGMDVENVEMGPKAIKILYDGQVIILRDGAKYNILGQPIR